MPGIISLREDGRPGVQFFFGVPVFARPAYSVSEPVRHVAVTPLAYSSAEPGKIAAFHDLRKDKRDLMKYPYRSADLREISFAQRLKFWHIAQGMVYNAPLNSQPAVPREAGNG